MFNIFKKNLTNKKKIELENIRNYKQAIKTIKYFIATLEWEKAKKAIEEILNKERNSFKELVKNLEEAGDNQLFQKEKEKLNKDFSKKQKELNKLSTILNEKRKKYDEKIENEKFKVRFKIIKKELEQLTHNGNSKQALNLLNKFLEENPGKNIIIKFYNKQKKYILKKIEKEKEAEEKKLKQNTKLEALKLIGKTSNILNETKTENQKKGFFGKIKEKFNIYQKIKKKIENKKLIDEVNILIQEEDKLKQDLAESKLANIHKGLIKEISRNNILGYTLYGKILGAHKISGDTFNFVEDKKHYTFFIGDATGHGIKAGFIITLLTRLFNKYVSKKSFKELIYEINNGLKQDLKSMNFITSIFFQISKEKVENLEYIGLGHEPMLIYKAKNKKVEKLVPGGLAAGIRLIKDPNDIKVKNIILENGDILLTYSDGITEAKSKSGEYYGIDRIKESFEKIAKTEKNINKIYEYILEGVKDFRQGANFDDDLTLLLLKRDINKDIIKDKEKVLEEMGEKDKLSRNEIKKLKGKTKEELQEELEELKRNKQMNNIIKQLEQLWLTGEILKLKEEAKRYIKAGFIHPKINYYLKKAIDNQQAYKISLKEERIRNKYNILKELMKKGDYNSVIKEAEEIIAKDGNL